MELGRVLWEARTCSRQNRYDKGRIPFCWYPVRPSARQFQPDTALQVIENRRPSWRITPTIDSDAKRRAIARMPDILNLTHRGNGK
jgi:hypothetical protein